MGESESVDTVVPAVHHVVLKIRVAARCNFEGFVAAASCDDCVGGSNGWDDVLYYALSQGVSHAGDVELLSPRESFLK